MLAFFDWALLGRQLPGARSWAALLGLLLSAVGYTVFDKGFKLTAYFWCEGIGGGLASLSLFSCRPNAAHTPTPTPDTDNKPPTP